MPDTGVRRRNRCAWQALIEESSLGGLFNPSRLDSFITRKVNSLGLLTGRLSDYKPVREYYSLGNRLLILNAFIQQFKSTCA